MVPAVDAPQLSATRTTVLFIDDSAEDLRFWCGALQNHSSHNYTVLDAPSAEALLRPLFNSLDALRACSNE